MRFSYNKKINLFLLEGTLNKNLGSRGTFLGGNLGIEDLTPFFAKVIYLNFQPFEVVDRGSETQPQVVENYSCLFNLGWNIYKSCCLNTNFLPDINDLID